MSQHEPLTDEQLVACSRSESDPACRRRLIGELFSRYQKNVALWCYRFTGDREAGSDLAQEIFLKVYASLDSFRCDSRFSTWLYSICRNHCLNYLKASRRRALEVETEILEEFQDESAEDLLRALENESSHRYLRELMDSVLTKTEITVLVLHYGEEISLASLNWLLRLENPSGAKAFVVSARRKLQRALQRQEARQETMRSATGSAAKDAPRGKR